MTPEQTAAIVAKAQEVYALRTAYLAAQTEHNDAITAAQNAEAEWVAGVNAGNDEATLTELVNDYVGTEAAQAQKFTAMTAAKAPYDAASAELTALTKAAIDEATGATPSP